LVLSFSKNVEDAMITRKLYFFVGWLGLPWLWVLSSFAPRPPGDPAGEDALWLWRTRVCASAAVVAIVSWIVFVHLNWKEWPTSFMVTVPDKWMTGW
jgi:hypothetical protein